jgi:excisionase family DNA binding protein
MLGISLRYLQELTHNGEIPHIKLGRATLYVVEDLREWLRSRRVLSHSANGIPPGPTSEIECDA